MAYRRLRARTVPGTREWHEDAGVLFLLVVSVHNLDITTATWISPRQVWTGEMRVEVTATDSGSHVTSDLGDEWIGETAGSF